MCLECDTDTDAATGVDMSSVDSVARCVACQGPLPQDCTAAVCQTTEICLGGVFATEGCTGVPTVFGHDTFNAETTKCSANCSGPYGFRVQDQPYCLGKYFLQGTLGRCSAAALHIVDSPARNFSVGSWRDQAGCEHAPTPACDPQSDPENTGGSAAPALCSDFDFFSGALPTSMKVVAGGSSDAWQIFETGEQTREDEGTVLGLQFKVRFSEIHRVRIEVRACSVGHRPRVELAHVCEASISWKLVPAGKVGGCSSGRSLGRVLPVPTSVPFDSFSSSHN